MPRPLWLPDQDAVLPKRTRQRILQSLKRHLGEAGTEAHTGWSAISQRHMILRGYFAMRDHVDTLARMATCCTRKAPRNDGSEHDCVRHSHPGRHTAKAKDPGWYSAGLLHMCSRDSLQSFRSLRLEAACLQRCVSSRGPHDRRWTGLVRGDSMSFIPWGMRWTI